MCVTATVLSMGTKFVNKEEIISGTCSEDLVSLHLSSLLGVYKNMYSFCLMYLFFLFV